MDIAPGESNEMAQVDAMAEAFGGATPDPGPAAALSRPLEEALDAARPRLLRQARRYGVAEAACEDIVQETLLAAWQNLPTLRAPQRFDAWIHGICRHLCWRWHRTRQRPEQSAISLMTPWDMAPTDAGLQPTTETSMPREGYFSAMTSLDLLDPADILDQQEMQTLIERALGYLSQDTRLLIQLCYLAEIPHRVVAERLHVSLSALEGRLFRARRELATILRGPLLEEAQSLGLLTSATLNQRDHEWQKSDWRSTRIWCPNCGRQYLRGSLALCGERTWDNQQPHARLRLYCPVCSQWGMPIVDSRADASLARLSSLRVALKHIRQTSRAYFARALAYRQQRCLFCGSPVQPVIVSAATFPEAFVWPDSMRAYAGSMLTLPCNACGALANETVNTYVADGPEVQAFRRIYPRLAPEPERVAQHAGTDAIQVTFHAVTHATRLRLFVQPHTLQTLAAFQE